MPYESTSELPESVRGVLPAKAQRMWMHVFNSAQESGDDEETAIRKAWSQVKKSYKKDEDSGKWVKKMSDSPFYVPFSETSDGWYLLFPTRKVYHMGREVNFTKDKAEAAVKNFKVDNTPPYPLPVNSLHSDSEGIYGTIADMRVTDKGVEWKPNWREGKLEEAKKKGFRFISPEIQFTGYQHVFTGKKYDTPVFLGAALTPRPRLGAETAIFSDEEGEWEYRDEDGNMLDPESSIYQLRSVYDTMMMLKRLERVKGMDGDARTAQSAMKRVAHKIIDAFTGGDDAEEFADKTTKTEDGKEYTKDAYLITPDPDEVSTWKIRVEDSPGKVTVEQLGHAAAALRSYESGHTYRGKSLKGVSREQVEAAKEDLVRLYKKKGVEKDDIPEYLFDEGEDMSKLEEMLQQIMDKLENGEEADFSEEFDALKDELRKNLSAEFSEKLEEKESLIAELEDAKEKAEKQAQELSERFAEEERKRRLVEFTDKAEELDVPVEADEFGAILMHFHDADDSEEKERYNKLVAVLESAQYAEELFEEMGSGGDVGDPVKKFEALVQERVSNGASYSEAVEQAAMARPDLYADYDKATVKVAQGEQ